MGRYNWRSWWSSLLLLDLFLVVVVCCVKGIWSGSRDQGLESSRLICVEQRVYRKIVRYSDCCVWPWYLTPRLRSHRVLRASKAVPRIRIVTHWHLIRRIVSRTVRPLVIVKVCGGSHCTFEPSQTSREWCAYCSTTGRMLDVTMRCARLKL